MKIYWYEGSKNIIGGKVKALRKEKGLSQKAWFYNKCWGENKKRGLNCP